MKISIIVTYLPVSREIDKMTLKCLELIHGNTYNTYDLTIVSNGKVPESLLSEIKHDCEILESATNSGNAFAWDKGISSSQNSYIVLMDNDVFVRKNWDKEMIDGLSKDNIGVTFPFSVLGTKDYRAKQYRGRKDGFCFAFKKDTYDKAGPFLQDQPFHSYYEDDNYFMNVMKLGLDLVACENSKVFHKGQGTTQKIMNQEIENGIEANKQWFNNKWGGEYPYLTK